jgi:zinc and cadmium transporter
MELIWWQSLIAVAIVSLISLIGVFTLTLGEIRLRRYLLVLVALSAGSLFGDVFFHLLPEICKGKDRITFGVSVLILTGILFSFFLEKFLHWGHAHNNDGCAPAIKPLGYLALLSDTLHNFVDGVIIAASFLVSFPIGLTTTLAVIFHEIPQEIADFGVLLYAGFSRRRALLLNLLSASSAVVGAIFVLLLGADYGDSVTAICLPIAAGNFLYIAGSNLVPELHKTLDWRKSFVQLAALLLGICLMAALLFFD